MQYYVNPTDLDRHSTKRPLYPRNNILNNNINYGYRDDHNQYIHSHQTSEDYYKNLYGVDYYSSGYNSYKDGQYYQGGFNSNTNNHPYNQQQNYTDYGWQQEYLNINNDFQNPSSGYHSKGYPQETFITFDKKKRMKVTDDPNEGKYQTYIKQIAGNYSNPYPNYNIKGEFTTTTQQIPYYDTKSKHNMKKKNNYGEFAKVKQINTNNNYENQFFNLNNNNNQTAKIITTQNDINDILANIDGNNTQNEGFSSNKSNTPTNNYVTNPQNEGFSSNQTNPTDIYTNNNDVIPQNDGFSSKQNDTTTIPQNEGFSSKPNDTATIPQNEGFSSKQDETTNNNNTIVNQENNANITNNNNNPTNNIPNPPPIPYVLKNIYCFNKTGLYNIGSTCYMNSTLQCLLHVSPLVEYFIEIYSKQKHYERLLKINESAPSKGKISQAFFGIIKSILQKGKKNQNNAMKPKTNIYGKGEAVSPDIFQKTVGTFNPQFRNLEANDSKDLILYLLQAMHQELNYWTNNPSFTGYPNQYDRVNTFQAFICSYDATNKSIISDLFYGTSENTTKCEVCNNIIYNFQKIEFLTFGVCKYNQKDFNLYNGFDDYIKIDKLTGDNQYYCNYCKKLCDALIRTTLLIPPKYLLINIDYGKNKKYMPSSINYDEEIDISKYVNFVHGKSNKYNIIGICSHLGDSGMYGHYVAYCKNKNNNKWYQFNDSFVSDTNFNYIKCTGGTPYLLLYERID